MSWKIFEALTGWFGAEKVIKGIGDLFDGPEKKAPEPITAPDYQKLWKTYSGELQNINVNTNRELADVRARLSAAGASPDSIKMQTEFLEAQRTNKIGELDTGTIYSTLKEGFEIAGGTRANPYSSALPQGIAAANLLDYYAQLYGGPEGETMESAASRRAKLGASGGGGPGAAASSSNVAASPWLSDKQSASFW